MVFTRPLFFHLAISNFLSIAHFFHLAGSNFLSIAHFFFHLAGSNFLSIAHKFLQYQDFHYWQSQSKRFGIFRTAIRRFRVSAIR